jgi:ribosomal protein L37E
MSTYESVPETPAQPSCSSCGGETFDPGFVEDAGEGSRGYTRWIPGPLERGIFGGARKAGKQRFMIEANRCSRCGFLMMYAKTQV